MCDILSFYFNKFQILNDRNELTCKTKSNQIESISSDKAKEFKITNAFIRDEFVNKIHTYIYIVYSLPFRCFQNAPYDFISLENCC